MEQRNCIKGASKACLNTCCVKPLPQPHGSPPKPVMDPCHNFNSAVLSSIQPNTYFTNHESLPTFPETFSALKNAFPSYDDTLLADHIRSQEYRHLANHVCLDYTGHGLFSYSQLHNSIPLPEIASSSSSHAANSPSAADVPFFDTLYSSVNLSSYLLNASRLESEFQALVRRRITRYMNVLEKDYSVVFTANQSSAFKLLADSYPFHSNQELLTVYDYDNEAAQSMIESAKKLGARPRSAAFSWPSFNINSRKLRKAIVNKSKTRNRGLFAFPLQSRITGSRYSYQWMNLARENGWHVMLDACALGEKEMETLGLSLFQPDFLICSFFKIFGQNPSGFCTMFIKKSTIQLLNPSSTTMGIITITPEKNPFQRTEESETLELQGSTFASSVQEIVEVDQIPNPKSITGPIEFRGLDHADKLGLILISNRLKCLVNWLVNALLSLRHPHSENGLPLVTIYGPRITLDRGPAIAFNVYDWKGERVDPTLVQKLAGRNDISVALGFLRNVWVGKDLKLENRRKGNSKKKEDWGICVASISVGMMNNFKDVYRVWGFVARFLDADFVEKERWRYTDINQTTVEV